MEESLVTIVYALRHKILVDFLQKILLQVKEKLPKCGV